MFSYRVGGTTQIPGIKTVGPRTDGRGHRSSENMRGSHTRETFRLKTTWDEGKVLGTHPARLTRVEINPIRLGGNFFLGFRTTDFIPSHKDLVEGRTSEVPPGSLGPKKVDTEVVVGSRNSVTFPLSSHLPRPTTDSSGSEVTGLKQTPVGFTFSPTIYDGSRTGRSSSLTQNHLSVIGDGV